MWTLMDAQERTSSTRRFQFLGAQEAHDKPGHRQLGGGGTSSAGPTLDWNQLLEAMQLTEDQRQVWPKSSGSSRLRRRLRLQTRQPASPFDSHSQCTSTQWCMDPSECTILLFRGMQRLHMRLTQRKQ